MTDIDVTQLYDPDKSVNEGAITVPGYKPTSWPVQIIVASGLIAPDKPIRDYTDTELHNFLYREATKVRISNTNQTYEGRWCGCAGRFCRRTVTVTAAHSGFCGPGSNVPHLS